MRGKMRASFNLTTNQSEVMWKQNNFRHWLENHSSSPVKFNHIATKEIAFLSNLFAESHNLCLCLVEHLFSQRLIPFACQAGSVKLFLQVTHLALMARFHGCHFGVRKRCLWKSKNEREFYTYSTKSVTTKRSISGTKWLTIKEGHSLPHVKKHFTESRTTLHIDHIT